MFYVCFSEEALTHTFAPTTPPPSLHSIAQRVVKNSSKRQTSLNIWKVIWIFPNDFLVPIVPLGSRSVLICAPIWRGSTQTRRRRRRLRQRFHPRQTLSSPKSDQLLQIYLQLFLLLCLLRHHPRKIKRRNHRGKEISNATSVAEASFLRITLKPISVYTQKRKSTHVQSVKNPSFIKRA